MWRVKSFQSASASSAFDLDDGSYYAYIEDDDRLQIMPTIKSVSITRGQYPSTIVGVMREMDKTAVMVRIRAADWRTALKNLSAAVANDEQEPGTLTVADETGTEWTIQARVTNLLRTKFQQVYKTTLDVPDLIWRKVAAADVWNITASRQTTTITNTGNRKIRPQIKFKPTAVKADGFLYRHWVPVWNPNNDRGVNLWGMELTDGGLDTRAWVKDTANYMQINNGAGINNSQTTIPYDTKTEATAGIIGTYGMGYIDNGVHQEQICWTGRTGTNSGNLTGITRSIGGTSPYSFADNVKIYLSYMKADGSDLRCYKNDVEQNLWIDSPNAAATRLWVVANEPAGVSLTLSEAISSSGDVTEINLQLTVPNFTGLGLMPAQGVVRIGDEAFHYNNRDLIRFRLDVDKRSINDTLPEAHSIGDTIYCVPNDYWLYSGNPFLSAQVTVDTRKPLVTLDTSDNDTRAWTNFWDKTGLRSDAWKPDVEQSSLPEYLKASQFYTGNHMTIGTDPATDAGVMMQSIYRNGLWRYEDGVITWTRYEPAGIASVTSWAYDKYRTGSTWPTWVRLEKSKDGLTWENVVGVVSPTATSAWQTASVGPYSLGTGYYYLRVIMMGVQGAGQTGGAGYISALETDTLTYTTVAPLVPEIMTRSLNSYEHNFRLHNNTNGYYFKLIFTCPINSEIEVDCDAKTVTTLADGKKHRAALYVPSTQRDWMIFDPGDNVLEHVESSVTGLTTTITHQDQLVV